MNTRDNIIVIGGSAGSFPVVCQILSELRSRHDFPPVLLALHRLRTIREGFATTLSQRTGITVVEPDDKAQLKRQTVFLAPANYHMVLESRNTIALSYDEPLNFSRPAIDLTMISAGYHYGDRTTGVILSGANRDGVRGMYFIHKSGGKTVIQDPDNCKMPTMTQSCVDLFNASHIDIDQNLSRYL